MTVVPSWAWPLCPNALDCPLSNSASELQRLASHMAEHPPPGLSGLGPLGVVFLWASLGSVVSKTLTRFHVATLGRRIKAMKKTMWADLHVGKFSRVITH